jgi:hypothetical protein
MRDMLLALTAALLIAGCSRVTQENFLKVRDGMTEEEVIALLGRPTESNSVNLLGVSGTSSRWVAGDAVISIQFVNGKVAFKSFDKPGAAK